MKKFLLSILAVCGAFLSASADRVVYEIDYSQTPWDFYVMGYTPEVVDGVLVSNQPDAIDEETGEVKKDEDGNPVKAWYQYFIADQIPTQVGKSYEATVKIKTSTDASLALNMGWGWGEGQILNSTIDTTPEWAEISMTYENIGGTSSNLVLQPGMYGGTVEIEWVKVTEIEDGDMPSGDRVVYDIDYATTPWNFYVMGYTPEVVDGVLVSNQPDAIDEETGEVKKDEDGNPMKAWYQYFIADQIPTQVGKSYEVTVKIKTSTDASLALNMGWGWGEGQILNSTINTTTEWQEISQTFKNIGGTSSNLVLQPGMYDGTVEIEWVKVTELADLPDDPDTPSIDGKMIYDIDYATTPWNFYVMGYAPEVVDGVLVSNQPDAIDEETGEVKKDEDGNPVKAWYQYFIADQIPTEVGKSYTAVVKIKTSTDTSLALNMGWGWGEGQILNSTINTTTEWQEISQTFENIGGEMSNLVLQPGMYDGTVEIEWVKVFEAETSGVKTIVPIQNNRTVVYNLLGVKVLDTDDASQLNTLKKGIYIVNGKKVAL